MQASELIYVHDPMCSWCWAFRPVRMALLHALAGRLKVRELLGGLAADSDEAMSPEMRLYLQGTWQRIQKTVPGTQFNYAFWRQCQARRSTYPACRAVISAGRMQADAREHMTLAIQRAYYQQARNPSDITTLVELAGEIGLQPARFTELLHSDASERQLRWEIESARQLPIQGFPSLVLRHAGQVHALTLDYQDAESILQQIANHGAG